jgi:hypothetical protein
VRVCLMPAASQTRPVRAAAQIRKARPSIGLC